jgi:tetratricopeptide (TPR) repeat protein
MTQKQLQLLEQYNKALSLYKQRKWKEALQEFKKALEIVPDDGPSQLYIERCKEYIKNPPPDDWDGVFVMKTK